MGFPSQYVASHSLRFRSPPSGVVTHAHISTSGVDVGYQVDAGYKVDAGYQLDLTRANSIEAGKWADPAVWDGDPYNVLAADVKETRC